MIRKLIPTASKLRKFYIVLLVLGVVEVFMCLINLYENRSSSTSPAAQHSISRQLLKSAVRVLTPSLRSSSSPAHASTNSSSRLNWTAPYAHRGSEDFHYSLHVDILDIIDRVKRGLPVHVRPVNDPHFHLSIANANKCGDSSRVDVLILIKSAPGNTRARKVIRDTWGREECWGRREVRRIFLSGIPWHKFKSKAEQAAVALHNEAELYGDMIQANFVDHYFNNTYKMMLGFFWASTHCRQAKDILFVDDDYFVQPRAVVAYLETMSPAFHRRLIAGYVWRVAYPVRKKRGPKGKWFISKREYPWYSYPPYCAAGAFFVSAEMLQDIYIAMKYTKYIRFDDVFLGLVLHKMLVVPIHLNHVHSFNKVNLKSPDVGWTLASHGFKTPQTIYEPWRFLQCSKFCAVKTAA